MTETLNVKTILLSLLMLLLPPGELFLFYFMKDTDTGSFLTGFITLGMLLLVFVFVFLTGLYQKTFLYNNGAHPERLLGVYVLGLLLVAVNSFLPCQLWLFLPLAVYFGFTGEKLVAILIMLGSPTTVSCYIMAKNMNHEGTLTSSVVVATTFLSSVTLTVFLFILRSLQLI